MSRGMLTLLLVIVPAVQAENLSFVERWSRVSIEGEIDGASPPMDYYFATNSTLSFDPFDAALGNDITWGAVNVSGTAQQVSTLSPAQIEVHGHVYAAIDDPQDDAVARALSQSDFELTFDVDQPTPIALVGHLYLPPGMGPPTPFGAHVRLLHLLGPGEVTLFELETEDAPFEFLTTLDPGRYFLDASCEVGGDTAIAEGSIIGSTWFDLNLAVVPEPTTALLLILGLTLLRRKHTPPA